MSAAGDKRDGLDYEQLQELLGRACRKGASASRMETHNPELLELLASARDYPNSPAVDRALNAEAEIRSAIARMGGRDGQAISIILGLTEGTMGKTLTQRRAMAARLYHKGAHSITGDSFRRSPREKRLTKDLATLIYDARKWTPVTKHWPL